MISALSIGFLLATGSCATVCGQIRIADFSGPSVAKRVAAPPSVRRPAYGRRRHPRPLPPEIARIIVETAIQEGVDHLFILEVMRQESGFYPTALSSKGARGLMQFIPATARRFAVQNPDDPREAVRGACQYIRYLAGLFGNSPELVLAGYNAGEGAVLRAGRRIPRIAETQQYVAAIMAGYTRAKSLQSRITATTATFGPIAGTPVRAIGERASEHDANPFVTASAELR
ncbi:MAG: lytic transglycosylase domain-containing protein [Blastocatellia bacterium]